MSFSKPLITIITPTYNAGKFIQKCLESVLEQSFKNFEHLILDGESSDDTVTVIRRFQQKHDTIKLQIEKDEGVYDAMNIGIELANGEWIYFLGADDYLYDNDVLKNIAELLEKKSSGIVYGNVFFQNLQRVYDGRFDIEKILKHNICHQAIFYHMSVFETVGNYDLIYRSESDYDLNLRCWLGGKIEHTFIPITIAFYADGGISSQRIDEQFIKDYPEKAVSITLHGAWKMSSKIHILSKIYRKLFQRSAYTTSTVLGQVFRKDSFFVRSFGFLWMCLSSPFYLLKGRDKTK